MRPNSDRKRARRAAKRLLDMPWAPFEDDKEEMYDLIEDIRDKAEDAKTSAATLRLQLLADQLETLI